MKKLISLLLVMVLCYTLCISAYAEASVYAIGTASRSSMLSISSTTATCKSTYTDTSNETAKVVITQSLEKHSGWFWIWDTVGGEWTKTTNGSSAAFTNKVYNLTSGTYRVKTVFEVTAASGETETITIYSEEKTI